MAGSALSEHPSVASLRVPRPKAQQGRRRGSPARMAWWPAITDRSCRRFRRCGVVLLVAQNDTERPATLTRASHGNQDLARRCCSSTRPGATASCSRLCLGSRNQARSVGSTWSRIRDWRSILGGNLRLRGRRDGRSCASLFDPDPFGGLVIAGAGRSGGAVERRSADPGVGHEPAGRLPAGRLRHQLPRRRGGAVDRGQPDQWRQHRRLLPAGPLLERRLQGQRRVGLHGWRDDLDAGRCAERHALHRRPLPALLGPLDLIRPERASCTR